MAANQTYFHPPYLTLDYGDLSSGRYIYLSITVFGYVLTIALNVAVISTIVAYKCLHEPMYIFISALCVNGLYGSTAFFPPLLFHLLQEPPTISYAACLIQIFCIHTYVSLEMTILFVMAYDRYVSICNPLRYNTIMTLSTVYKLIAGASVYPNLVFVVQFSLTLRLPLCKTEILKIYCDNWSVVRLSCIDTTVNNIFGLLVTVLLMIAPLVPTVYSYSNIIRICMKSSKEIREKALQTCTPHFITLLTFQIDTFFEILLYRFVPSQLPYELRVFTSIQSLVTPPILNPVIYGMKMKEIKTRLLKPFKINRETHWVKKVVQFKTNLTNLFTKGPTIL